MNRTKWYTLRRAYRVLSHLDDVDTLDLSKDMRAAWGVLFSCVYSPFNYNPVEIRHWPTLKMRAEQASQNPRMKAPTIKNQMRQNMRTFGIGRIK